VWRNREGTSGFRGVEGLKRGHASVRSRGEQHLESEKHNAGFRDKTEKNGARLMHQGSHREKTQRGSRRIVLPREEGQNGSGRLACVEKRVKRSRQIWEISTAARRELALKELDLDGKPSNRLQKGSPYGKRKKKTHQERHGGGKSQ